MREARPIVLLVDDEPHVLSALKRTLRREGLEIETAGHAREALDRLAAGPPVDLVISDHKRPGQAGVDLLGAIRRDSPRTARILLSGWASEIPEAALQRAGCAPAPSKPWDDTELKVAIQAALAGR